MPKYITYQEVENYLSISFDDDFVDQVNAWIDSVEEDTEKTTHRVFVDPGEDEVRYYDGNNKNHLFIDECLSITSLAIDGVVVDPSKYVTQPYNKMPIYKIVMTPGDTFGNPPIYFYRSNLQNVSVTANWAYSATCPTDLALAMIILVAGILLTTNPKLAGAKMEVIGEWRTQYDDGMKNDILKAKDIIAKYTKVYV